MLEISFVFWVTLEFHSLFLLLSWMMRAYASDWLSCVVAPTSHGPTCSESMRKEKVVWAVRKIGNDRPSNYGDNVYEPNG